MKIPKLLLLVAAALMMFGCGRINQIKDITDKIAGDDKLYFCERYDPVKGEIGEAEKFTTGRLTVMVKLKSPIGVRAVDINVTDKATDKVVETFPFTVTSDMDYIYFPDVNFEKAGKYKVSCLKEDGTVIATGEVEII